MIEDFLYLILKDSLNIFMCPCLQSIDFCCKVFGGKRRVHLLENRMSSIVLYMEDTG